MRVINATSATAEIDAADAGPRGHNAASGHKADMIQLHIVEMLGMRLYDSDNSLI